MDRKIEAKFRLGQVIHNAEMDYRGVILDVDPMFFGGAEIAEQAVADDEPLDRPWYHVLADGREHVTYVSEASLKPDDTGEPVCHPSLRLFFTEFLGDHYVPRRRVN